MMKSYIVYSDTCLSFGTLCSVMQVKLTEISNNATLFNMQVIQDSGYSGLCLRGKSVIFKNMFVQVRIVYDKSTKFTITVIDSILQSIFHTG